MREMSTVAKWPSDITYFCLPMLIYFLIFYLSIERVAHAQEKKIADGKSLLDFISLCVFVCVCGLAIGNLFAGLDADVNKVVANILQSRLCAQTDLLGGRCAE